MRKIAICLFLSFLCAGILSAQTAPKPPAMFYVHEEFARPGMIGQYEQTAKEFSAMIREANPQFYFDVFSTDDFRYYYVAPINSMADVDRMNAMFAELPKKFGSRFMDLMKRGGATMDHSAEWVVRNRMDLSYKPAKPRVVFTSAPVQRFDFYYLQPGMEMEVDGIAAAWKSALGAKNLGNGFNVFEAVMGGDLPVVIVQHWGNSEADIAAGEADDMQKLGNDTAMSLQTRTMMPVRRYESHYARIRPELSNFRPMTPAK